MKKKYLQYKEMAALLLSILVTMGLVMGMVFQGGNAEKHEAAQCRAFKLSQQFDSYVADHTAIAMGQAEEVKKTYTLNDNDLVAPEPDQAKFGTVSTPAEMAPILEKAKELLGFENSYFSVDTELMVNKDVKYYLDDTIFSVTWKEAHENIAFTFSEVKIAHPSQFRRFLSGGKYGAGVQTLCSEMAASVNAVVATNGDFYGYQKSGTNVYNGIAYRYDDIGGLHTCMIDENGDLNFVPSGVFNSKEEVQAYADENDIRFSLCFGPVMVDNGELQPVRVYRLGEVNGVFSRAAICQMDELHYLMVTANYEDRLFYLPDMTQFARIVHSTGCQKAYALDGGQSATMIMNDAVINQVSYGDERKQSDIIYFATAMPGN